MNTSTPLIRNQLVCVAAWFIAIGSVANVLYADPEMKESVGPSGDGPVPHTVGQGARKSPLGPGPMGPFPPIGVDNFESFGSFAIVLLNPNTPFGPGPIVITDLTDPATIVGRSNPFTEGDPLDDGAPIGGALDYPATSPVAADPCIFPEGFPETPSTRREVHTEILTLNLTSTGPGFPAAVRAGQAYFQSVENDPQIAFYRNSFGEVASLDGSGNPANDFPADSFFNIYVEAMYGPIRLYNRTPMVLRAELDSLPPDFSLPAFEYTHDPAFGAVPLYNCNGVHVAFLVSAGHGGAFSAEEPPDLVASVLNDANSPVTFAVDDQSLGLPATLPECFVDESFVLPLSPNHVRDDGMNPVQQLTPYQSSGLIPGLGPDSTNIRVDPLVGDLVSGTAGEFVGGDAINSFSFGEDGTRHAPLYLPAPGTLFFSVDRDSEGQSCTPVWTLGPEMVMNSQVQRQAAALFATGVNPFGTHDGKIVGEVPSISHVLALDATALGLRPVVGDTDQDNVTALEKGAYSPADETEVFYYATFTGDWFGCSSDGLPGMCMEDCNGNGLPDGCDIANGVSTDANGDGVPDECQYCAPNCPEPGSQRTANIYVYKYANAQFPNGPLGLCDLSLFASASDIGLQSADVIDAMVLSDITPPPEPDAEFPCWISRNGMVDPLYDELLFSLAPASPSLWGPDGKPGLADVDDDGENGIDDLGEVGFGDDLSPATVFYSGFDGVYEVFVDAYTLGLLQTDNIDALDICPAIAFEQDGGVSAADQLHIACVSPLTSCETTDISAWVEAQFQGIEGLAVEFKRVDDPTLTGSFRFITGECWCEHSLAVTKTDQTGQAIVRIAGEQPGTAMIEIRVPGSNLSSTYCLLQILPPVNDACIDALPISDGLTPFCNLGASTDGPDEPGSCMASGDSQIQSDVWYEYIATCSGTVTVDLCDSDFDTKLGIYDKNIVGCPIASNMILACNDDYCGDEGQQSAVSFPATAGQTYLIRIGGFNGDQGHGNMFIDCRNIVYVKYGNSGPVLDGKTWITAYPDLQSALVSPGSEVWVTGDPTGLLDPYTPGLSRSDTYLIPDGTALYGGFLGDEIFREQRNVVANPTVLSGAIGNPFSTGDNIYHIVTVNGVGPTTVIDGFVIRDSKADGSNVDDTHGGGLFNNGGAPIVRNCAFEFNFAFQGAGIYNQNGAAPTIIHCRFEGNSTAGGGGGSGGVGVYCRDSQTYIEDCSFLHNQGGSFGGGIANFDGDLLVIGCEFHDNRGATAGGAIFNIGDLANPNSPRIINCRFVGNGISSSGGALELRGQGSPTILNCEFSGNSGGLGGAISTRQAVNATIINSTLSSNSSIDVGGGVHLNGISNATILNSILWGNTDTNSPDVETQQVHADANSTFEVHYSCVEDDAVGGSVPFGGAGNNNIDQDPLFNDVDGSDNIGGTLDDDPRLKFGSPCIDAADSNLYQLASGPSVDVRNMPRFFDDVTTADSGAGIPPYLDMGAYEFNGLLGDLNQNGVVDIGDLHKLMSKWGRCATCPEDLNGDGVVGTEDILLLIDALQIE